MTTKLTGYPRADGRWGFRNHVLVLPLHAAACPAAARVVHDINGAVTVIHDWERLPGDPDAPRVDRLLHGFASHPNVAATVAIGLLDADADGIPRTRADLEFISLERHRGTRRTVDVARPIVESLASKAQKAARGCAPISALCVGLECGGSDALSGVTANPALGVATDVLVANGATALLGETSELIGAEHLLARRAHSAFARKRIVEVVHRLERELNGYGVDLRGSQPSPGNIAAGLTTIEEKSLGAAKKGGTAMISGVVEYAERPPAPGLFVMDTPGHDIEQMVGMVAGGAQVVAFTTGLGTPTGSPIAPCLKISSNSELFRRMRTMLDLDAGMILEGHETVESMGVQILDTIIAVANGQLTASEKNRNHEFAISRIHPAWNQTSSHAGNDAIGHV